METNRVAVDVQSSPASTVDRLRGFFSWKTLLAVLFWGLSFIFTRFALDSFHPYGVVATRMFIGTAVLVVVLRAKGLPLLPDRRDLGRCALLGLLLGIQILLQAFALRLTTAIASGWIVAFNPVTIALGGQIFLGQRVRALGWLGALVASGGLAVIALAHGLEFSDASIGDLLVLISCLLWTAFTLIGAPATGRSGALRVTTFAMSVAGCVCAIAALTGGFLVAPLTLKAGLSVGFLGVFCSGIAFALWMSALDQEGSAKIAAMLYFQPFVTLVAAALLLSEPVTSHALVGGPLVLVGVALLRRGSPRPAPRSAQAAAGSTSVAR